MRAAPRDRLDLLFLAVGAVGVLKNTEALTGISGQGPAGTGCRCCLSSSFRHSSGARGKFAAGVCCSKKQAACVARRVDVFGVLSRATRAMSLHARAHSGL